LYAHLPNELIRISKLLNSSSISQSEFEAHGNISVTTVRYTFGSWNTAIEAAGLMPNEPGRNLSHNKLRLDDDAYLREIVRLTEELGKKPTLSLLNAKGKYSVKPYRDRWGTFSEACDAAYHKFGNPQISDSEKKDIISGSTGNGVGPASAR
jgi:hypothetical protein